MRPGFYTRLVVILFQSFVCVPAYSRMSEGSDWCLWVFHMAVCWCVLVRLHLSERLHGLCMACVSGWICLCLCASLLLGFCRRKLFRVRICVSLEISKSSETSDIVKSAWQAKDAI